MAGYGEKLPVIQPGSLDLRIGNLKPHRFNKVKR